MWLWRRKTGPRWLAAHEDELRQITGRHLAVVSKPGGYLALLEVAGEKRSQLRHLTVRFGGRVERLAAPSHGRGPGKPLSIGSRLVIVRERGGTRPNELIIPAGNAFGTGEHATTAMSLRLLERCTRKLKRFSLLDLGTGSGILALAAARFGGEKIIALDSDPRAIATAKANAVRNEIRSVDFRVADVRAFPFRARVDFVTANLFSELLVEILPRLPCARYLILSGVLASQERAVRRVLRQQRFDIVISRRRGKWIALLVCPANSGKKRVDDG